MDLRDKLDALGQAARYDDLVLWQSSESAGRSAEPAEPVCGHDLFPYVSHVIAPDGRRRPILKVLQTSVCQNNCHYCAFRAGRDVPRARLTPDELARGFDLLYRSGVVQGLFLSSGLARAPSAMDAMLATAELLRKKLEFRGYLHLKLLPGAEADQIREAVRLADRVSANLEAPTVATLANLAPQKQLGQLAAALQNATRLCGSGQGRLQPGAGRLGVSTQFVVGPAGESDRQLLAAAERLYRGVGLARIYYSAFNPVPNTPLAGSTCTDPLREFRLYQADFLLRHYGFTAAELTFAAGDNLQSGSDPKLAWAQAHPEHFPVEVNRASVRDLLRVPGIGPASARAITQARRSSALGDLSDLRRMGVRARTAAPYIVIAGRRSWSQLALPGFRSSASVCESPPTYERVLIQ